VPAVHSTCIPHWLCLLVDTGDLLPHFCCLSAVTFYGVKILLLQGRTLRLLFVGGADLPTVLQTGAVVLFVWPSLYFIAFLLLPNSLVLCSYTLPADSLLCRAQYLLFAKAATMPSLPTANRILTWAVFCRG
jgi:hypothetical protein